MEKIGIYYRVSTDKQAFDMQEKAVNDWLEKLPTKPRYRVFKDFAESGKKNTRPKYAELKKRALAGEFDAVVCYRLDRFSRSSNEAITTILALKEAGVNFVAVDQPHLSFDADNPFSNMLLAAFADIAQIEREIIVSRVKRGLEAAKAKGKKLGRPSIIDSDKLQKMHKLSAAGLSTRDIGKELGLSYGTVAKHLRAAS